MGLGLKIPQALFYNIFPFGNLLINGLYPCDVVFRDKNGKHERIIYDRGYIRKGSKYNKKDPEKQYVACFQTGRWLEYNKVIESALLKGRFLSFEVEWYGDECYAPIVKKDENEENVVSVHVQNISKAKQAIDLNAAIIEAQNPQREKWWVRNPLLAQTMGSVLAFILQCSLIILLWDRIGTNLQSIDSSAQSISNAASTFWDAITNAGKTIEDVGSNVNPSLPIP